MKKHILGATIFSFIFASFVFAFAFFNAPPIPEIAAVDEKVKDNQRINPFGLTSCSRSSSRKKISVEIINSEFHLDENKIVSEVKLDWNGTDAPPKTIYLLTSVASNSGRKSTASFDGVFQILENPFNHEMNKTFKVVSRIFSNKKINTDENLYVVAVASESADDESTEINKSFSETKAVVFVHSKNSVFEK